MAHDALILIFSETFADRGKLGLDPERLLRETLKVSLVVNWRAVALLPHHIVVLLTICHAHVKARELALAHLSIIGSILDLLLVAKMRLLLKLLILKQVRVEQHIRGAAAGRFVVLVGLLAKV